MNYVYACVLGAWQGWEEADCDQKDMQHLGFILRLDLF